MPSVTDPAEELATVCKVLGQSSKLSGADWLARNFDTQPYSEGFYKVLFSIIDRAHGLKKIVSSLDETAHLSEQADRHLDGILNAFRPNHLGGTWSSGGASSLSDANVAPVMMLSASVRPHIRYPKLSDDERDEILKITEDLLSFLREHQLEKHDFIRQALIDGLEQFAFRLNRLKWLGWGYSLEALKDVIGAYLALERGFDAESDGQMIDATLRKVAGALKSIYSRAGTTKQAVETADFFLRAYGTAAIYINSTSGGVSGLLTFGS